MPPSPRRVRNFWISADVDGRRSRISGGPRGRGGGISLTLYQRCGGEVAAALNVECIARSDGTLCVEVEPVLPSRFSRRERKLFITTKQ